MNNQAYTQRVQALAEKMAAAQYEKSFYEIQVPLMPLTRFNINSPLAQKCIKSIAPTLLPAARLAVAEMADMAKCLYHSRFVREGYSNDKAMEYTQKELKYQGLIPDNETDTDTRNIAGNTIPAGPDNAQEGGNNGNMGIH